MNYFIFSKVFGCVVKSPSSKNMIPWSLGKHFLLLFKILWRMIGMDGISFFQKYLDV